MVKRKIRYWAHYVTLKTILGLYVTMIFGTLGFALGFSYLANSTTIDSGIDGAVKETLLIGMEYYGIALSVITVLIVIWFLWRSDQVELTDTSILYYRTIFSKLPIEFDKKEVTKCVFSDGVWKHNEKYMRGKKILIFHKQDVLIVYFELYYKLCVAMIHFFDKKAWLVDDNYHLKSVDNYYKIEFATLTLEQQLVILKDYCKLTRTKYKTGEEIIRKLK